MTATSYEARHEFVSSIDGRDACVNRHAIHTQQSARKSLTETGRDDRKCTLRGVSNVSLSNVRGTDHAVLKTADGTF